LRHRTNTASGPWRTRLVHFQQHVRGSPNASGHGSTLEYARERATEAAIPAADSGIG